MEKRNTNNCLHVNQNLMQGNKQKQFFITSASNKMKRITKQKKCKTWRCQNKCHLFLHDKLLWHLELHSLLDFLHEQRLLRHDVLQLHLLYPWPQNSDAFPAHSLNEILTDGLTNVCDVNSILCTCTELVSCIPRI